MELTGIISGLNRKGFWLSKIIWPAAHPCRYDYESDKKNITTLAAIHAA
jgi:hypothetical protein